MDEIMGKVHEKVKFMMSHCKKIFSSFRSFVLCITNRKNKNFSFHVFFFSQPCVEKTSILFNK